MAGRDLTPEACIGVVGTRDFDGICPGNRQKIVRVAAIRPGFWRFSAKID
jgi:hypothetical protein